MQAIPKIKIQYLTQGDFQNMSNTGVLKLKQYL